MFEEPAELGPASADASVERELDVAKLKVAAGDSIVLRAYAEDSYDAVKAGGEVGHGRVRSAPRVLRIVGEDEFERQIRGVFAGVRRDAMRLDERQAKTEALAERRRDLHLVSAKSSRPMSQRRISEVPAPIS